MGLLTCKCGRSGWSCVTAGMTCKWVQQGWRHGKGPRTGEPLHVVKSSGEMDIRPMTRAEFAVVAQWRHGHFEHIKSNLYRPIVGQKGFDDAAWVVMCKNDEMVAAASFTDEAPYRWVHDLYGAPTHALAALALAKALEYACDKMGLELRGNTDPENHHFIQVLIERGYQITSVGFRRPPQTALEEASGSH